MRKHFSSVLIILCVVFTLALGEVINGDRSILGIWDASGSSQTLVMQTGTVDPGTCTESELFWDTDAAVADQFRKCESTNVFSSVGGGGGPTGIELLLPVGGLTAPPTAGWTWVNQGTATVSQDSNGRIHLQIPTSATANVRLRVRSYTAPQKASSGTFMRVGAGDSSCGIGLRESGTSKLMNVIIGHDSGDPGETQFLVQKWTNETSFSANELSHKSISYSNIYWFEVEDNNTTIFFRISTDGVNYYELFSEARGTFFTTAPNQFTIRCEGTGALEDIWLELISWEEQ